MNDGIVTIKLPMSEEERLIAEIRAEICKACGIPPDLFSYRPLTANRLDPAYQCRSCGKCWNSSDEALNCEYYDKVYENCKPLEEFGIKKDAEDSCQHQWADYHGIVDHFTYCKLCDKRKE